MLCVTTHHWLFRDTSHRLSIHNPMVPSPPLKRHFLMPQILKTLIGTCYEWIIVWILVCMDTCTYMDMI